MDKDITFIKIRSENIIIVSDLSFINSHTIIKALILLDKQQIKN
jgi:predicted rRNA methylase YqxC with S4 and FtsJ domains